ncbi:MAG: hypothetical protein KA149_04310 [Chitinophagales bacterium]|nr:hypothetical protein [Chitinophagales bacterium]
MKKVIFTASVAIMFLFSNANALDGNGNKKDGKKGKKKEMVKGKEHVCNSMCIDGKHSLAHGQKGHACTEECHKKM